MPNLTLVRFNSNRRLRRQWHNDIRSIHELSSYLASGSPQPSSNWAERSQQRIFSLISGTPSPSQQRDEILQELIREHSEQFPPTKEVAILSFIGLFRRSTAVGQLLSLREPEVERYLRCILVASESHHFLVSESEALILRLLLSISDWDRHVLETFARLIEAIAAGGISTFLDTETIRRSLIKFGVRVRIELAVESLKITHRFASLYIVVSRLLHHIHPSSSAEVRRLLDEFFPAWPHFNLWRPSSHRIHRWEHGNFTGTQRSNLECFFVLDGPDVMPARRPASQERLLEALCRAENVGPQAVDLFIFLCSNPSCRGANVALLEDCIHNGDNAACLALHSLIKAYSNNVSLSQQMKTLIYVLPSLSANVLHIEISLSVQNPIAAIVSTWRRAQEKFLGQVTTRRSKNGLAAEPIGMLMHELATKILGAPWLHEHLPPEMLDRITRLPPSDVLETIFLQLHDATDSIRLRFTSFLTSTLGGGGPEAGDDIQDEVLFWKRPPNVMQRDLAHRLGEITTLEYQWYTNCLKQIAKEKSLYIDEMRHIIQIEDANTIENFANYLSRRRGMGQLQNECWLILLAALIGERDRCQDGTYFEFVARSMTYSQWDVYISDLNRLFTPTYLQLPEAGYGLTKSKLDWWERLAISPAVSFLLNRQDPPQQHFMWIYFPVNHSSDAALFETFLDTLDDKSRMTPLVEKALNRLQENGRNWVSVLLCIQSMQEPNFSSFSQHLCETFLERQNDNWPKEGLVALAEIWGSLIPDSFKSLFFAETLPAQTSSAGIKSASRRLLVSYQMVMAQAKRLESMKMKLRHSHPSRTATLLRRIKIEDSIRARTTHSDFDDILIDAVDTIGVDEYEISFPLTGLSDLQRSAKGIPSDARMLALRFQCRPESNSAFCLHYSPQDDQLLQHQYWVVSEHEPTKRVCNATLSLFTYQIARVLHRLLKTNPYQVSRHSLLRSIHETIQDLVDGPPKSCLVCLEPMTVLWKPAACSIGCSLSLLNVAPLEVLLHNFLVDPLALDLLLTSIYAAANDNRAPGNRAIDLLSGCPISRNILRAVIDSMPPLASYQNATNLQSALRGSDRHGVSRERLLSWLSVKFRGFLISAPKGFRVPNMGLAKQFLLVNSQHEREAAFRSAAAENSTSGLVFHGTGAARLFCILANGLRVMRGNGMLNGAAYGPGIYLGDEQSTSLGFATSTGQSWRHSELRDMSIMLGCELARYTHSPHHPIHVITDENRILVRYIFLLPRGYQCPPKHHVEPKMLHAFATLRSGLA